MFPDGAVVAIGSPRTGAWPPVSRPPGRALRELPGPDVSATSLSPDPGGRMKTYAPPAARCSRSSPPRGRTFSPPSSSATRRWALTLTTLVSQEHALLVGPPARCAFSGPRAAELPVSLQRLGGP